MPRPNKYLYLYVVQGNYGGHGWEDLAESVDAMWTVPGKGHLRRNREV